MSQHRELYFSLIRNVFANFSAQIILGLVSFLFTPFLIRYLGMTDYGLWTLIESIIGIMTFWNMGMGISLLQQLNKSIVSREFATARSIFAGFLYIYVFIGLILGFFLSLFSDTVCRFAKITANPYITTLIFLSSLLLLVTIGLSIVATVPAALQRLDYANWLNIFYFGLTTIGAVVILKLRYGLREIIIFQIFLGVMTFCLYVFLIDKILPELKIFTFFSWRPAGIKDILPAIGVGLAISIGTVFNNLLFPFTKILIARFYQLSSVTLFTIPLNLASQIKLVAINITSAVLPASSELFNRQDRTRWQELYRKANLYVFLSILPLVIAGFIFGPKFLIFWLGENFLRASEVLKILVIAFGINFLTAPTSVFLQGSGRYAFWWTKFVVVLCLLHWFFVILLRKYGISGVSLSYLFSSMIVCPIFVLVSAKKVLNLEFTEIYFPVKKYYLLFVFGVTVLTAEVLLKISTNIALLIIFAALVIFVSYILTFLFLVTPLDRKRFRDYFLRKVK